MIETQENKISMGKTALVLLTLNFHLFFKKVAKVLDCSYYHM